MHRNIRTARLRRAWRGAIADGTPPIRVTSRCIDVMRWGSWVDEPLQRYRTWKKHRRKQYKPVDME